MHKFLGRIKNQLYILRYLNIRFCGSMDFAHRQVSLSPTEGMVTEGGEVSEGDQGSQKQMIKAESLDEEGSRGGEKAIVEVQPLLVASSNKVYTCTYMYILYSVYILQVKFYI